jgi:peroxiredoxin
MDHRGQWCFDAIVIDINRSMLADSAVLEANGLLLGDEDLDTLAQRALVALERERNQPSCR